MISLLMPTRGRPDNLKRLYQSIIDTADEPRDIELIIAFDEDDDSDYNLDQYLHKDVPIIAFTVKRQVLSKYWNDCYERSKGVILMHLGDDIVFRTQGWDTAVKQKFAEYPDHIVFVFGNDGSPHDGVFGTHGFIHRKWAETVGYFVPPYFSSDFNDTHLNDVAQALNRHIHIPILTEHMHPSIGKAEWDKTHQERLKRHKKDRPDLFYYGEEMQEERRRNVQVLTNIIQSNQ